jgi:hypothetical protein
MTDAPSEIPQPTEISSDDVLPPWVQIGGDFYGHKDWTIKDIVGKWIRVEEKTRAATGGVNEAWIYLPSGVVYGNKTLLRRSDHGLPTASS